MNSHIIDPAAMRAELTQETLKPYYTCDNQGVFYHAVEADKEGNILEKPPFLRLSDPIELIGRGIDSAGNHYRMIEWQDRIKRKKQQCAISTEDIGSHWGALQRLGIAIHANRRKRELLADYLQSEGNHSPYLITDRAGWHEGAYILPNGDIIGTEKTRIHYNGDKSQASAYQAQGSLAEWQANIARYAQDNSRLCLAIGAAFAAPLMRLLDIEGGGVHLYGDSSDGKTTAAKVALSVWGEANTLKLTWEGTGLGFSNIACARNDGLLILDEIGQAAPKVVSHTAYAVINGTSKIQARKEGGNRTINQWRVFVLSTGEKTLQSYVKTQGEDWQAGQANRLPSLPANAGKGLGIYDTLHGFENGALLSEHLELASNRYYGSAGRAFIEAILQDQEHALNHTQALMDSFMNSLPMLTGQARRVGKRFALIAAALELAKAYGIIQALNPSLAIRQCFEDWHVLYGSGKYEDKAIIEQAIDWLQQNAYSHRLVGWQAQYTEKDHAGYRRYEKPFHNPNPEALQEIEAKQEFWIIPAVFRDEICQSYETEKVCSVLVSAQWLKTQGKRNQCQRSDGSRYYVFLGLIPPTPEPPNPEA